MRKKLYAVLILAMLVLVLTACGKKKEIYDSGEDGYTQITSVDGISFDVVADAARNATAVTNISEEMAFETDQTYVFKDGEEEYFLFRIDSIVCVAQKGTSFGLKEAEDKLEAVETGNILGIYFTSPRKKLDFVEDERDGNYKLVATVTAQVALTSELYNDFAGRLAYLYDGKEEWTMFVGTIGNDFEKFGTNTKDVITYMAATMKPYDAPGEEPAPEPAVMLGGENELSTNAKPQTVSENTVSSNTISGDKVPVDAKQLEIEEEGEQRAETEESYAENEIVSVPEEIIVAVESNAQSDSVTLDQSEEDGGELDMQIPVRALEHGAIRLDNQKNTVRDDVTVYHSDVYDMLEIGKRAYASVLMPDASGYQTVEIKADKIYTGSEAKRIIVEAYRAYEAEGDYFDPPEGCTFHVIHYTAVFPSGNAGYINVKLRGMDGENLRFRGICYTQRTYDIKVSDTEFYAFYAVPNGCKEYVVEIGEGTNENMKKGIMSAYYRYQDK